MKMVFVLWFVVSPPKKKRRKMLDLILINI